MKTKYIIGADEVGNGALAGPVCVGAVIAPVGATPVAGWGDSKKLTPKARERVAAAIKAPAYSATAMVTAGKIDELGITGALRLAYITAVNNCIGAVGADATIEEIRIDGNFQPGLVWGSTPVTFIVKGDGKDWHIGAGSCVAKVERDAYMVGVSGKHPQYMWHKNKGYGTRQHKAGIEQFGLTSLHRKSFCKKIQQGKLEVDGKAAFNVTDLFG